MRSLILSALGVLLVSHPAFALRGVLPETECERLSEVEASLGSTLLGTLPREPTNSYSIIFKGRSHGREASISYRCESGKTTSQLIAIKVESEYDGQAIFSDWHRELSSKFGLPFKDLDEPSVAELEEAVDHPTRRVAIWVIGERVINLTLWGGTKETWEVVVAGP
jgi:hypothetical protein